MKAVIPRVAYFCTAADKTNFSRKSVCLYRYLPKPMSRLMGALEPERRGFLTPEADGTVRHSPASIMAAHRLCSGSRGNASIEDSRSTA